MEDPDAPGVLAETQFWCTVNVEKKDDVSMAITESVDISLRPETNMVDGILSLDPSMPAGLAGPSSSARASPALNGDVLRAFDEHNASLAAVAGVGVVAGTSIPIFTF